MTWTAPHALQVLFSPEHGFLFWTPLAVVAIAGPRVAGDARWPTRLTRAASAVLSLLMVALQVYVGGSVESWTVAGAFGQRRFVALTVLLVIGCRHCWEALRASVAGGPATIARSLSCVWWNLALMALFGTGHDGPPAAGAGTQRLRCFRHAAAHGAAARLPLLRSIGSPSTAARRRRTSALTTYVRILYFADIRFPLERANGIQTMETCHALRDAGMRCTSVVRPDTHVAAARSVRLLRPSPLDRPHDRARARQGPVPRGAWLPGLCAGSRHWRGQAGSCFTRDLGIASFLLRIPARLRPPVVYESHGYAPDVAPALPALVATARPPERAETAHGCAARSSRVAEMPTAIVTITRASRGRSERAFRRARTTSPLCPMACA